MVDDQQRDALHFGRRREAQHRLALAVRAEPLERPALVGDLALRVEHLQQPFVALRFGVGPLLRFLDDLPRVVGRAHGYHEGRAPAGDRDARRSTVPPSCRAMLDVYSYSSASTSEPRTADSAGQIAATNAAPRIVGTSASAVPNGKLIIEPHAGDVVLHDLQDVVQIERAEREAEDQPERADAERLDPDRAPDLPVQTADRLQHAELAAPVGDRHRQRVDDAENRDQHGDGDLHRRQAEPLIGDLAGCSSCSSSLVSTNTCRCPA